MKRVTAVVVFVLLLQLAAPSGLRAQGAGGESPAPPAAAASQDGEKLPGVELAQAVATATGIAITPLFGLGAVGAWHYFKTPPELRAALPWYTSTWFWVPAILIVVFLLLKEPILGWVPIAKKPLDALEVLESKVSALVATPAVVPMFIGAFSSAAAVQRFAAGEETARLAGAGVAFLQAPDGALGWVLIGLAGAVFLAAFLCVWLAFHVINVLILLSPFGPLDMLLRMIKLLVLAVLVAATLIHAYLGLAVALVIVAVAIPLAVWSFRLSLFGATLAWDLLTFRHRRTTPGERGAVAFTARPIGGAPSRIRGRLVGDPERGFRFVYRRAVIGPRSHVEIPHAGATLCRGALWPLLRVSQPGADEPTTLFRLAPRYRTHEETLVSMWVLPQVEDGDVRRGLTAALEWLREMAGRGAGQWEATVDTWRGESLGR